MPTSRNNKTFREYISFLEKLRADNKERLHNAAFQWNKLANDRSSELSKHLFTIASLVLPLSLIPVTNIEIAGSLTPESKSLLALSWFFFVLSLVVGIIHLRKESNFFNKWAKQENERSYVYSDAIFTTNPVDAYNRLEQMDKKSIKLVKMSADSDTTFLLYQQLLLVLGITMIGLMLVSRLFEASPIGIAPRDTPKYMRKDAAESPKARYFHKNFNSRAN